MKKQGRITRKQCAETGLVIALGAVFTGLLSDSDIWQYLSAGLILASLLIPLVFYPFAILWFGLSAILGSLTSGILLYLIFFFIVTPVGLIRKIAGKDRLKLKDFRKNDTSAFIIRNHLYEKEDLIHPF